MIFKTIVSHCFVLLLLSSSVIVYGQSPLGYQLGLGEVYVVRQNAHQVMTQKMDDVAHEITNDLDGLFQFTVEAKTDEEYTLALVFKDFAIVSTSSIQGVLMDVRASDPKEGDIFSEIFSALLNQKLALKMTRAGKITSVVGGDELINKMINAVEGVDEFSKNLMRKSLEKDFGSEGLARSFEQMTYFYPERAVGIGDTWKTDFQGKVSGTTTWTLEKIEAETTAISGTAAIVMNNKDGAMTLSLKGTQETLIQVASTTGFLQKMMVSGSGKGNSIMTQMGDVEIPTTLEQKITYELITE